MELYKELFLLREDTKEVYVSIRALQRESFFNSLQWEMTLSEFNLMTDILQNSEQNNGPFG